MTTNVAALVQKGTVELPHIADLWNIYKGYVDRPKNERARIKRALAHVSDGTLLDMRAMFDLPEAWREDGFPTVAVAPMTTRKVGFVNWISSGEAGFYDLTRSALAEYHFLNVNALVPRYVRGEAQVPATPKSVAPWNPITRRKCFVLFDADWKALPVDPYLLYRVNEQQFKVVGHWDLTDKERQLMALMGG